MIRPVLDAFLGVLAVWLFIRMARRGGAGAELRCYAGGLVIASGVYVAFGLVLGGPPLGFELIQLAAFVGAVLVGLRYSPLVIAAAWMLHSVWDAMHAFPALSQHAPEWYSIACIACDVPLSVHMVMRRGSFAPLPEVNPSITKPIHQE